MPVVVVLPQLKVWRRRRLWTQVDLARAAGVDQSTVNRIEQGGAARLSTARKLLAALGVDPREVAIDEDGNGSSPPVE